MGRPPPPAGVAPPKRPPSPGARRRRGAPTPVATPGSATRRSAPDEAGRRRGVEHGLGDEVIGDRPRLAGGGVEVVAKYGREGGQKGVAHALVVGGAYPVAEMPGTEFPGVREKLVEPGHGVDDRGELLRELDLLLGNVRVV